MNHYKHYRRYLYIQLETDENVLQGYFFAFKGYFKKSSWSRWSAIKCFLLVVEDVDGDNFKNIKKCLKKLTKDVVVCKAKTFSWDELKIFYENAVSTSIISAS